jgi:hypothetical protein
VTWTFSASVPNYLSTPQYDGASCWRDGNDDDHCEGGFSVPMYANTGSFHGTVTVIPDDEPGVTDLVDARGNNWYRIPADAGGQYDFDVPWTPVADPIEVFGDGAGPGRATYELWLSSRPGGFDQRVTAATASNVNTQVDLVFNTGEVEDEPRPDCEVPPSGVETPEAPPRGVGQPVNPLNGNVFFDQTDAVLPGVAGSCASCAATTACSWRRASTGLRARLEPLLRAAPGPAPQPRGHHPEAAPGRRRVPLLPGHRRGRDLAQVVEKAHPRERTYNRPRKGNSCGKGKR